MSNDVITILTIMAVYLLIILGLGLYSFRFSRPTMEDYHMAGREFNTFILFCAVFGTNISAVALIGGPGKAYHLGWGVWAYFVTAWGWLTPVLFYVIGNRAWKVSSRFFLITQSDLFLKRFSHKCLSRLTSCVLIFYTVIYHGRCDRRRQDFFGSDPGGCPLLAGSTARHTDCLSLRDGGRHEGHGLDQYGADSRFPHRQLFDVCDYCLWHGRTCKSNRTGGGKIPAFDGSLQVPDIVIFQLWDYCFSFGAHVFAGLYPSFNRK